MVATAELRTLVDRTDTADLARHASTIEKKIPIYDCAALEAHLEPGVKRDALLSEMGSVLLRGAGVFVLKGAFTNTAPVDAATSVFMDIIEREKAGSGGGGDHFAEAGNNDRVWNSLEKLCLVDPQTFLHYHSNRWLDFASRAWLGPAYQMTAQVNLVRPGGKAQEGHCDYHLGFMSRDQVEQYPPHIQATSAQLTLQGGIAHCDMPVESGTTKLVPFSQIWSDNYRGFREDDVRALFEDYAVQLPLAKGDMIFFSPGLLHGAGANTTADVNRMANLVQVSSAFGRSLEAVNRTKMCKTIYPLLAQCDLSAQEKTCLIANTAEGYPFPTDLDRDPPIGGLAPPSQQDLMHRALEENWDQDRFSDELDAHNARRA